MSEPVQLPALVEPSDYICVKWNSCCRQHREALTDAGIEWAAKDPLPGPAPWNRCDETQPPEGVYVVCMWDCLGADPMVGIARRGVPGWYGREGVEKIAPAYWMPLPGTVEA